MNYNDPVSDEENRKMELAARRRSGDVVHECVDNDETAAVIAGLVHARMLVLHDLHRGDLSGPRRSRHPGEGCHRQNRRGSGGGIPGDDCVGASRAGANGARAKLAYALESVRNGSTVIIGHARHHLSDLVQGPCALHAHRRGVTCTSMQNKARPLSQRRKRREGAAVLLARDQSRAGVRRACPGRP